MASKAPKSRYEQEIERLPAIYKWARKVPLGALAVFAKSTRSTPLIVVGSGGTLAVAAAAELLHEERGRVAKSVTPLELVHNRGAIRSAAVMLLSSSGRNRDILNALRVASAAEPKSLIAVCGARGSALAAMADRSSIAYADEYELPSGKDGFLATASVVAMATLLVRCYSPQVSLPPALRTKLTVPASLRLALARKDYLVLFGGWGTPAAIDLESKLSEAALGSVQLADYRNFGHGRHNWIAKRPDTTTIVAIIESATADLAQRTLHLIPKHVPVIQLDSAAHGPCAMLELLAKSMHLVAQIGRSAGVDPARPRVPPFGRKLFHLTTRITNENHGHRIRDLAIERKTSVPTASLSRDALERWVAAYKHFVRRMRSANFSAIVCDYDGTLCDSSERFGDLSKPILAELRRLLRSGITVGIATGRGKSVREALRKGLARSYWKRVVVGYYNGAQVGTVDRDDVPQRDGSLHQALVPILKRLEGDAFLIARCEIEVRPTQVSVQAREPHFDMFRSELLQIVLQSGSGARYVESSHSADVIPAEVSKMEVVRVCEAQLIASRRRGRVVCIGDRGKWPGNDFELLATPYSLSVDTVSPSPDSCWHLASPGNRGVQAAVEYLRMLSVEGHAARMRLISR